jgi:hypothetical protein
MADKWIQGAIKHPGALTRQAKAAGKTVSEFCSSLPAGASSTTKRRCALAGTLKKMNKGR